MKRIFLFLVFCYLSSTAQVTVIPWPSTEDIWSIDRKGPNILICGMESNLAKCYGDCNTLIPVNLPVFAEQSRLFTLNRPDSNYMYLNYSALPWEVQIWRSKNAGVNWSKVFDTTGLILPINNLHFFDSLNGLAVCPDYRFFKTSDGLSTYTFGTIGGYFSAPRSFGVGDSTFMVGNFPSGMNITYNRGNTWSIIQGISWTPIGFCSLGEDSLFSISNPVNSAIKACFYSSFDGGLNWSCKPPPGDPSLTYPEFGFSNVKVNKNKELFLFARDGFTSNGHLGYGVIFKSPDFGETWYKFVTPFKVDLNDMTFLNDSVALVCGNKGVLFKWNHRRSVYTEVQQVNSDDTLLRIFPNPASESFKIELKGIFENTTEVRICGIDGRALFTLKNHDLQNDINLFGLQPGVYLVEVKGKSFTTVSKLIKQ